MKHLRTQQVTSRLRQRRSAARQLLMVLPLLAVLLGGAGAVAPALAAALSVTITGSSTVQVNTPATFNATVTGQTAPCSSATQQSYNWLFSDTGVVQTAVPSVTHTFTQAGQFTVTLLVTDTCQDSGSSNQFAITATATGTGTTTGSCTATTGSPITVSITPNAVTAAPSSTVTFGANASGAAGNPVYSWNFGDNTTGSGPAVSHAYTAAGTYTVTLTVTDSSQRVGCGTATATISGTPTGGTTGTGSNATIRVAPNGPYTGAPNQSVSFGGFAQTSNSGATITGYQWNFGDNTNGSGQFVSHTYSAAGSYTVTLTVTDSSGQSSSATTTATIGGTTTGTTGGTTTGTGTVTANGVTAGTGGPYSGSSGSPITFNSTGTTSNANARIVSCVWIFGDNSSSAPCNGAMHTYDANGTYTAVVTVVDSTGAVAAASTTVTVSGTGSRTIALASGCTNIAITFADGTATTTVANGISPSGAVLSIWKQADPSTGRYRGFFPGATQASDLPTLNRLDAVFICVNAAATLTEPSA